MWDEREEGGRMARKEGGGRSETIAERRRDERLSMSMRGMRVRRWARLGKKVVRDGGRDKRVRG